MTDNDQQVSDVQVREYMVSYTVIGTGAMWHEIVWAADAEKAIRNVRETIRRTHQPSEEIRRLGITIDSVELQ